MNPNFVKLYKLVRQWDVSYEILETLERVKDWNEFCAHKKAATWAWWIAFYIPGDEAYRAWEKYANIRDGFNANKFDANKFAEGGRAMLDFVREHFEIR